VLITTGLIVAEGVEALRGRPAPRAGVMLVVALAALFVNGFSAWLLHGVIGRTSSESEDTSSASVHNREHHRHSHGHALNLRGASLHLMGDTLGALAAVAAALVVRFGGHPAADPIAGFAVAAILLVASTRLVGDAAMVLLEAAPTHLPEGSVRRIIDTFPGVTAVDELHVWTLGGGHDAITVHVRTASSDPTLAPRLSGHLRRAMGAEYVTVQVEATAQGQD
jgi:cobalt-zinc-cadmium efflux system protein